MAYQLEGRLLEVCTCSAPCPCGGGGYPDGGTCYGAYAWHVDRGTVEGQDVSDLTLLALTHLHGNVLKGNWGVVFYVDDKATDQQQEALLNAWTGKLGGPLADLAQLIGQVAGVERAPIDFQIQNGKGTLKVGQAVEAELAPSEEAAGHPATPHDYVCIALPGDRAEAGQARRYRIDAQNYGVNLNLEDQTVVHGGFRFEG